VGLAAGVVHSYRITIAETGLAPETYSRREVHRGKDDWCVTWTESAALHGCRSPVTGS